MLIYLWDILIVAGATVLAFAILYAIHFLISRKEWDEEEMP